MIKIDNFFDYLENLSKVENFSIDLIEIEKLRFNIFCLQQNIESIPKQLLLNEISFIKNNSKNNEYVFEPNNLYYITETYLESDFNKYVSIYNMEIYLKKNFPNKVKILDYNNFINNYYNDSYKRIKTVSKKEIISFFQKFDLIDLNTVKNFLEIKEKEETKRFSEKFNLNTQNQINELILDTYLEYNNEYKFDYKIIGFNSALDKNHFKINLIVNSLDYEEFEMYEIIYTFAKNLKDTIKEEFIINCSTDRSNYIFTISF